MGKKNPELIKLIKNLSEKEEEIWKDVAERLSKTRKNMAEVNVEKINRFAKNGEDIIVPGKVLGYGKLEKKVRVAAFKFSKEAKRKIESSGGKCLKIEEFIESNPKGSKAKLLG